MNHPEFGTFFVPGPTEVRREILASMSKPMIPHRSTDFENLFVRLQTGLRNVFQTTRPVYVTSSSATGMMEAAMRCTPPGVVLCLVNGAFSERFARIADACGREIARYEVPWGSIHDPDELEKYLEERAYAAVAVVHSETSTGALNPVKRISDTCHRHGTLCLIDSVSGVGGAALRFDEWRLDYVLTGSQKALALPPGLAFAVASENFVHSASRTPARGVYFDIVELDEYMKTSQVPSTPSLSLLYALETQLESIAAEGLENRWQRHAVMAAKTQEWLAKISRDSGAEWKNLAPRFAQSPTVTTVEFPSGIDAHEFIAAVAAKGIRLGGGYGKLRGTTFRIGHMGDHTPETLGRCLDACEQVVRR